MKKYLFIAAALATLASCTKNASMEVAPVAEDNAIGFSAYTSIPATKGKVESTNTIGGYTKESTWTPGSGIGVFTFYQPASNGNKTFFNSRNFATPDFMYNQKVYFDGGNTEEAKRTWKYEPVKYWPNNEGDLLSFFAYAPYEGSKTWETLNIKTDAVASKLTASFSIADEVANQKDILWADPKINQTNKKEKANDLSNKLEFAFSHATSKVDIHIGVAQVSATASGATAWTDANTSITIKDIVFNGLYNSFDYVYDIDTKGELGAATPDYSNASTFNLTVEPYTGGDPVDLKTNASVIDKDTWKAENLIQAATDATNANYKKYLAKDEFMFLAPQVFTSETVTITYTVKTTDSGDSTNNSEITNVITKNLSDILGATGLVKGTAYNLKFLIGMDDVNISATVADWDPAISEEIDVPVNATKFSYFENGVYCGEGIKIGNTVWAPVNCGYHRFDFKYGKLYQWGRAVGSGYDTTFNRYHHLEPVEDDQYNDAGGIIQKMSHGSYFESPDTDQINNPSDDRFYDGQSPAYDWYTSSNAYKQLTCWPMKPGDPGYVAGKIDNPCPDGWRVPTKDELGNLLYTDWDSSADDGKTNRGSYDTTKKGWDFGNGLFFPAAGSRDAVLGKCGSRGITGFYYSSSSRFKDDDDGPQYDKYFSYTLSFGYSDGSSGVDGYTNRATACSVRCVYIQE